MDTQAIPGDRAQLSEVATLLCCMEYSYSGGREIPRPNEASLARL